MKILEKNQKILVKSNKRRHELHAETLFNLGNKKKLFLLSKFFTKFRLFLEIYQNKETTNLPLLLLLLYSFM